MGSQSSKTEKKDQPIKLAPEYWGPNNLKNLYNYDDSFSTSQNTQNEENSTKSSIIKEPQEKKYPFKFEWKGNGKSVLLAGSFLDNWNNIKVMVKNNNTETFETVVYLPKTKHQFKFIIDNKWICSNQYPTMPDERGIINNFIDLTNYIPPEQLINEEQKKKGELNLLNQIVKENNKNINNKIHDYNKSDEYTTKMPLNRELNLIPPNIIKHYLPKFNINYQSNQKKLGNRKYLKYKEKNLMDENNTYKKILGFPHEKLMHLCPNLNELNFKEKKSKNNYMKICTTTRNRHKFLTTVYYRPREII